MILGTGPHGNRDQWAREERHHPQHRRRTWDPQVRRLRQYQLSSRGMRKGLDTCPPLPQQQAEWRSSRSAERPAGVDTCPIPALGWRAGLPSRASSCEGAAPSAGHLARTSSRPGPPSRSPKAWLRPQRRLICFFVRDGGRGPWEERFGSFAKKKRATAPAIHHSHCLCCCRLARWASPRLWFSICVWDKPKRCTEQSSGHLLVEEMWVTKEATSLNSSKRCEE